MRKKGYRIFGCPVDPLDMQDVLAMIEGAVREKRVMSVSFLNAGKMVAMDADDQLRGAVINSTLRLADGQAIVWAARILGIELPGRVAGIDLMMELLKVGSQKGYGFYFLGARQDMLKMAAKRARELFPGLRIVGMRNGYFKKGEEKGIVEKIRSSSADILFVGISSPQKELFIDKYLNDIKVPVVMGVGGSFDVLAGKARRAPVFIQRLGLEWLYRLLQEPARLWKRYFVGNTLFIWKVICCRLGMCTCCGETEELEI